MMAERNDPHLEHEDAEPRSEGSHEKTDRDRPADMIPESAVNHPAMAEDETVVKKKKKKKKSKSKAGKGAVSRLAQHPRTCPDDA